MERGFEGVAGGGRLWKRAGICLVRRQRDPHAYTYAYARACTYVSRSRHGVTVARAPSSSLPCGTHVSHTCTTSSSASRCYKRNSRFASWTDVVYIDEDLEGEKRAILLRRVVQGQEFLSCNFNIVSYLKWSVIVIFYGKFQRRISSVCKLNWITFVVISIDETRLIISRETETPWMNLRRISPGSILFRRMGIIQFHPSLKAYYGSRRRGGEREREGASPEGRDVSFKIFLAEEKEIYLEQLRSLERQRNISGTELNSVFQKLVQGSLVKFKVYHGPGSQSNES